jgi:Ca-activated chloride channel family protein
MLRLHGKQAGRDFVRDIPVVLPAEEAAHPVIATLWARRKVDALMAGNWMGMQSGNPGPEIKDAITKLGVNFNLMTQFTSFVAVEESIRNEGGVSKRVEVPVEMPAGVSYDGIFGAERGGVMQAALAMAPGEVARFTDATRSKNIAAPFRPVLPQSVPPQSATRIDEDRRSQLSGEGDRDAEAKAAGFSPQNRKIDPVLRASLKAVTARKVQVKIWLNTATPEVFAQLKEAGFVAQSAAANGFVVGECDATRLNDIVKLSAVRYISKA